jgi:alcohol dehydrogenase
MAPATASAMVLESPRRLVRRQLPLPVVGDDDGLLRVEACGLCGTDHEQWSGALAPGFAFVPGHETVGVLEAVGPVAAARWGVAAGDRVAVEVFQSCRSCAPCGRGEYRRCLHHGLRDMAGFMEIDRLPGLWGGYASHQYLPPDAMVVPVPAGLDPVTATLFNPLGAGIRWAATVGGVQPGDVVAVLGPGIRGLAALVGAREAGAGFVMVTGAGARDASRLATARRFGADLVVDVRAENPVRALERATGQLARVVVDVTATARDAFAQALSLAAVGGTVVVAGTRGRASNGAGAGSGAGAGAGEGAGSGSGAGAPGFDPDLLVYKELTVLGALGVDTPAYRAAFALFESGRYPFADLPRRVTTLDDVGSLLEVMSGEAGGDLPLHGVVVP